MLADGTYDAFIVDVTTDDDGTRHLSLTILSGERKGEVVDIQAVGLAGSDIDLIGMPATVTVREGSPHLRVDT